MWLRIVHSGDRIDGCVWHYAPLVVHATQEEDVVVAAQSAASTCHLPLLCLQHSTSVDSCSPDH